MMNAVRNTNLLLASTTSDEAKDLDVLSLMKIHDY
jgi:hypothetical protein